MRTNRSAFTVIEMMISIVILSIMMIFLYQSYAALNKSNFFYEKKSVYVKEQQLKKRVVYLDLSLALSGSIKILKQDKNEDVLFMQSSNSLHKRFNPYIAYIVKNKTLYRLESLKRFTEYPLTVDSKFVVESFGEVESFRIYKRQKKVKSDMREFYLVHIAFKGEENILFKIKLLNEF